MNWFTMAGAIMHLLKNVPDLVDDIEDFFQKISGKDQPPPEVAQAVQNAISQTRQP